MLGHPDVRTFLLCVDIQMLQLLAVGLSTVAGAGDLDSVLGFGVQEHPIVATAETKTSERRPELFQVAGAVGQVTIQAVKNL